MYDTIILETNEIITIESFGSLIVLEECQLEKERDYKTSNAGFVSRDCWNGRIVASFNNTNREKLIQNVVLKTKSVSLFCNEIRVINDNLLDVRKAHLIRESR